MVRVRASPKPGLTWKFTNTSSMDNAGFCVKYCDTCCCKDDPSAYGFVAKNFWMKASMVFFISPFRN
jgi:hypothetical protein